MHDKVFSIIVRYFKPQICTPQNTSCMKNHANGTLPTAQKVSKEYMVPVPQKEIVISVFFPGKMKGWFFLRETRSDFYLSLYFKIGADS